MIALDTNVVVRLIARDDPDQLARAQAVLKNEICFVPSTVLLETAWVLRSSYGATAEQIHSELNMLLGLPTIRVADVGRVAKALDWMNEGLDFADAFHLADAQNAEAFVTFDRRLARRALGKGTCPVRVLEDVQRAD